MTKYKSTYRTETTRLKNWDYASPGYYFITICTQDHKPFFGQVKDDEMLLSPLGGMAETYWTEIPLHFANATLDELIIMPNHLHGIVIINDDTVETQPSSVETQSSSVETQSSSVETQPSSVETQPSSVETQSSSVETQSSSVETQSSSVETQSSSVETQPSSVETQYIASLQESTTPRQFGPLKPGSISSIIRSYKSAVTRWARTNGYAEFAWQSRFYDHIIRDEISLQSIRQYIFDNPLNWALDENNPDNLKGK